MEIQGVLRRSMAIIEERIIFDHSFPWLIVREGWNRRAVQQACKEKEGFAPASIKTKYRTIREHSEAEWHYMKEIQSLVGIHNHVNMPTLTERYIARPTHQPFPRWSEDFGVKQHQVVWYFQEQHCRPCIGE